LLPNITNIPLVDCKIYQNEPYKLDFDNLKKDYPTSKCLDFTGINKTLHGRHADLRG
jgi:hypothetical protein